MNLSIYKNKTNTELVKSLRNEISTVKEMLKRFENPRLKIVKIRSLIRELQRRDLTDKQEKEFKRLVVRFTWM